LAPPTIEPKAGNFRSGGFVSLHEVEPGAAVHYTLDGTLPLEYSPVYTGPVSLTESTTVRARAYKDGMVASIAVQETFVFDR
jgi:hypothetical protein